MFVAGFGMHTHSQVDFEDLQLQIDAVAMKAAQQLKTGELKARELSLKYLQLEQSGEHLNYLIRFDPKRLNYKSLEFESIDLREVFTLMVQSVYLMLNATLRKLSFRLSKGIHIRRVSSHHFTIHKMYLLEEHFFQLNSGIQGYVQKYFDYFPVSSNNVFQSQVMGIIYSCLEVIQRYSLMYPEFVNKVYRPQYEQFCFIVRELIRPNLPNIQSPVKLVECFQQSQVFRDSSLLLTIKANLLYDQLREHIEEGTMFEKFIEMQAVLMKQMSKGKMIEKEKEIAQWMEMLLRMLIEAKVVFSELSLEKQGMKGGNVYQKKKQNRWEIYTKQRRKASIRKHSFETLMNSSENQLIEGQGSPNDKIFKKNSFIVQYDSRRDVVTLKMLTNMAFTLESMDLLTYQASLTGASWVFPTLQVVETSQNGIKQKWLALSTFFRIMSTQHPTTQLLLSLDTLMVHSKILAFELNQPPYKRNLPHQLNLSQHSSERIHAILLAKIKRVYDAQLDDSDNED